MTSFLILLWIFLAFSCQSEFLSRMKSSITTWISLTWVVKQIMGLRKAKTNSIELVHSIKRKKWINHMRGIFSSLNPMNGLISVNHSYGEEHQQQASFSKLFYFFQKQDMRIMISNKSCSINIRVTVKFVYIKG